MTDKELDELDAAIATGVMGWYLGDAGYWCYNNNEGGVTERHGLFVPTRNGGDFITAWVRFTGDHPAFIKRMFDKSWVVSAQGEPDGFVSADADTPFILGCQCMAKAVSK